MRSLPLPLAALVLSRAGPCPAAVAAFRREMARRGPLYELVGRYAQALIGMMMQSTACNGLHAVEQRCARWLLMTHDRVEADTFPTRYRANDRATLERLAKASRFRLVDLELFETKPDYLYFHPWAYRAGIAYERVVNRSDALARFPAEAWAEVDLRSEVQGALEGLEERVRSHFRRVAASAEELGGTVEVIGDRPAGACEGGNVMDDLLVLIPVMAAGLLGINQPKVSALLNYRLQGFSVERLIRFLNALGHDVEIVVRREARPSRAGKIIVTAA